MKQCPICSKPFDDDATHCDVDGQTLETTAVSLPGNIPTVKTLGELIRLQSPFEIQAAVNLVIALCDAIEKSRTQAAGYLNPDNILLKNGSEIDVAALTLEIQTQAMTVSRQNLDEAAPYLSPEAAQQQQTDSTADVYSLGAILYEMLTGRPPFSASSAAAIAIKHILETPRPPRDLRAQVSEELQAVILRALAKERSSRQQSLAEFRRQLQSALSKLGEGLPQPSPEVTGALPLAPPMSTGAFSPPPANEERIAPLNAPPIFEQRASPPPMLAPPPAPSPPFVSAAQSYSPAYAQLSAPAAYQGAPARKLSKKVYLFGAVIGLLLVLAAATVIFFTSSKSKTSDSQTESSPKTSQPAYPPPNAPLPRTDGSRPGNPPTIGAPAPGTGKGSPGNQPPANTSSPPTVTTPPPSSGQNPIILLALVGVVGLGAMATVVFLILLARKTSPEKALPPKSAFPLPIQSPVHCSRCGMAAFQGSSYCLHCGYPFQSAPKIVAPPRLPDAIPPPMLINQDAEETLKRAVATPAPAREMVKQCRGCQAEFPLSVKFCVHDGTLLEEKSKTIPPDKEPSYYDLQTLDNRKRCPRCNTAYPENKKFCRNDGYRLVFITRSEAAEKSAEEIEPFMIAQYRCFARLGEGGMGLVYKARDVDLNRVAAVKVLLPKTANLTEAARLFKREAQLASSINHPNIVTIYSCGETNVKLLYMAMEFIEGRSLAEIIKPKNLSAQLLPLPRVLHITRCICEALDAAHERGIVHRDLKPQNVMLCRRANKADIVKVVDFGIARSLVSSDGNETLAGSIVGTPMYMSPEQARGEPDLDDRSDIFSLAIMVYQMLSGELPFAATGKNTLQVLTGRARLQEAPARLKTVRTDLDIPDAIDLVLRRALEPNKNRRTRSAMQFIEHLEQATR